MCLEDRNEKRARVVSGRWSFEAVSLGSARERRHEEVARSRAKRERKSFGNRSRNRSKSLFAAPWPSEKHGFYYTKRTWTLKKHGFYCTDRTSDVQNRSRVSSGRSGAIWGDSGGFGGAPGTLREALGELSRHSRRAPGRPRTPPGPSGATKKRAREVPNRFVGAFFSDNRSRDAPGTILGRFRVPRGRSGRRFCCALPVFCEGRAFFVETPARPRNRPKKARKWSPDRPRSLPEVVPDTSRTPGERSVAQDGRFFGEAERAQKGRSAEGAIRRRS